jgi:hypothetical protein
MYSPQRIRDDLGRRRLGYWTPTYSRLARYSTLGRALAATAARKTWSTASLTDPHWCSPPVVVPRLEVERPSRSFVALERHRRDPEGEHAMLTLRALDGNAAGKS